jgi:hypothetical protein
MERSLGLPLVCPRCPTKHYYGFLWAPTVVTKNVKYKGGAACANCGTALAPAKARV